MSSPKKNATPAEMAALAKLNQRLYGSKPEIGPRNPPPRQEPTRPTPPMPKRPTPLPLPPKRPDIKEVEPKRPPPLPPTPRRPDPLPPMPGRSTPLPQPVKPLPPMEPKRPIRPEPTPDPGSMPGPGRQSPVMTARPALRPTGKPSNRMEYKKGGSVPSASKRADGIAQRGKTRGKMC